MSPSIRLAAFFISSALLLACSSSPSGGTEASKPQAEPAAAATPAPTPAKAEKPKPATAPKPAPKKPQVREKPSEEACKTACQKLLGLAVEQVPEVRRRGAQSFMDAVVDEACPDKCMRSGTRASVACVNAAKTYEQAKACPGTP